MAAIPGLGGGLMPQDTNMTGAVPGRRFRCSDEMKASAVLLTSLGRAAQAVMVLSKYESVCIISSRSPSVMMLPVYCLCNAPGPGSLGIAANILLMLTILVRRPFKRYLA